MANADTATVIVGVGGLGALAWWLLRRRNRALNDLDRIRAFYIKDLRERFGWTGTFLPGGSQDQVFENYLFIRGQLIGDPIFFD